jgi:hypothetical protein
MRKNDELVKQDSTTSSVELSEQESRAMRTDKMTNEKTIETNSVNPAITQDALRISAMDVWPM